MPSDPAGLTNWSDPELQRFLEIRQEFFLDPLGSNKERFLEASMILQRALFDWYLTPPGKFDRMLALVSEVAQKWSTLRSKEERRTIPYRRFALNNVSADIPAVESSVSEGQWQKIFGSLGLGLNEPGTFDRFLLQLDEETNPSLRVNHRYLGELLPHDNMISYLSSITGTFLNENAIIGKVSPCVTHMEEAAVRWLLTLLGWDGGFGAETEATHLPLQRLPTAPLPSERYNWWDREEPTGTIVAGGTIANISALLIARNAVFDYLLAWSGAVQQLGPMLAWEAVAKIYKYDRLVVLTSKGAHYSVKKAALQAGVAPGNVIEIVGTDNPWVLDGKALEKAFLALQPTDLVIAVIAIAGKTETGYVDCIEEIARELNKAAAADADARIVNVRRLLPLDQVVARVKARAGRGFIRKAIAKLRDSKKATQAFKAAEAARDHPDTEKMMARIGHEIEGARHNRLFFHVDAAHGGGFMTVPELRQKYFQGIELADTVTIDGHKSFYCYYPCGGLLIRTKRWAQTFSSGGSAYISEAENQGAYREGLMYRQLLYDKIKHPNASMKVSDPFTGDMHLPESAKLRVGEAALARYEAIQRLLNRPYAAGHSELTYEPFNEYLEGSRGPQGIMQLYFNLATLGLSGYRAILGWTTLLRARCEDAISLGMADLRPVTDPPLPSMLNANDKIAAVHRVGNTTESSNLDAAQKRQASRTVVPITGGRFLRLSAGACNQVLITYVPAREAKLIAAASKVYWEHGERDVRENSSSSKDDIRISLVRRTMRYLWRINDHLWNEHIYANPSFSYYLGHTELELVAPGQLETDREKVPSDTERLERTGKLADLLTNWNAWTRQHNDKNPEHDGRNPFFELLAEFIVNPAPAATNGETATPTDSAGRPGTCGPGLEDYARKFFCHKIVVMHPYTDESLLGDMLRRLAFWGERSVGDVRVSDAAAGFFFPKEAGPKPRRKKPGPKPRRKSS